jgi:hypothetical protein
MDGTCKYAVDVGAPCTLTVDDTEVQGACNAAGACDLCSSTSVVCASMDSCQQPLGTCVPSTGTCSFGITPGATCPLPDGSGSGVCDVLGDCQVSRRRALLACTPGLRVIKNVSPDRPVRILQSPCQTSQTARVVWSGDASEAPNVDTDKEYMARVTFSCVTRVTYQCTTVSSSCGEARGGASLQYAKVTKDVPPVNGLGGTITGYVLTSDATGTFFITQLTDTNCAYKACRRVVSDMPLLDNACGNGQTLLALAAGSMVRFTGDVRPTACTEREPAGRQYAYVETTTGTAGWVERAKLGMCSSCSSTSCDLLQPLAETQDGRTFIVGTYNTPWLDGPWSGTDPFEDSKLPMRAFRDAQADFGSKDRSADEWLVSWRGLTTIGKVQAYVYGGALNAVSYRHLVYYLGGATHSRWAVAGPPWKLEFAPFSPSTLLEVDFYNMLYTSVSCDGVVPVVGQSRNIDNPKCHYDSSDVVHQADNFMFKDMNAFMRAVESLDQQMQMATPPGARASTRSLTVSSLAETTGASAGFDSAGLTWDWSSIGGYRTCLTATVSGTGDPLLGLLGVEVNYEAVVFYTMRDLYDFHSNKGAGPISTDSYLYLLPSYGLARVYAMEGTAKLVIKWQSGQQLVGSSYKATSNPSFTLSPPK